MITIIKIGTSVLFKDGVIDIDRASDIARQICNLHKQGNKIILVVSGAVAEGSRSITLQNGNVQLRSCAAGIGQIKLMSALDASFSKCNLSIAQILVTKEAITNTSTRRSIRLTLAFYLENNIVPVINENDVIDLNSFGGNDYLAVEIALITGAKQLLILSTMAGSKQGVGGGTAKLHAVGIARSNNITTEIIDGTEADSIINGIQSL